MELKIRRSGLKFFTEKKVIFKSAARTGKAHALLLSCRNRPSKFDDLKIQSVMEKDEDISKRQVWEIQI